MNDDEDDDVFSALDGPQPEARPLGGYADRVRHLLAIGQVRRAEETVADWLASDPGNPLALVLLSIVHLVADRHEAALAAVEQALLQAPELDVALEQRARVLFALARFREAEVAVLLAIDADPGDASTRLLYARLLAATGCERAALAECEASLELDPEDADGHAVLGAVHLAAHEIGPAEQRFRSALELQPAHGPAQRGLAEALMAKRPYYRPLLAYSTMLRAAPQAVRIAIVIGLWVLVQTIDTALRPLPDWQGARSAILWTYLAFCAYTWFAEPITRWLLQREYPWFRGLSHV